MNTISNTSKILFITAVFAIALSLPTSKAEASTRHTTHRPSNNIAYVNPLSWNPPVNPLSWTPFGNNNHYSYPVYQQQYQQPVNYSYTYLGINSQNPSNPSGQVLNNYPVTTYNNPTVPNGYNQPVYPTQYPQQTNYPYNGYNNGATPVTPNPPIYTDPNTYNNNPAQNNPYTGPTNTYTDPSVGQNTGGNTSGGSGQTF
jgi:hypothetical protein